MYILQLTTLHLIYYSTLDKGHRWWRAVPECGCVHSLCTLCTPWPLSLFVYRWWRVSTWVWVCPLLVYTICTPWPPLSVCVQVVKGLYTMYSLTPLSLCVQVVKGQYLNVGVSTISSPALCSTLLLGHTPRRPCLIAQCVKFKGRGGAGFRPMPLPTLKDSFPFYPITLRILSHSIRQLKASFPLYPITFKDTFPLYPTT